MQSTMRLVVIPRWAGTPESDWYPWLVGELEPSGIFESIQIAAMPEPGTPTIAAWTAAVAGIVGTSPQTIRNTVLVGHSVGCQAVLHCLGALSTGIQVGPVVCVAGWWDVDQPWESIRPWIAHQHDYARIKRAAPDIHVLLSDNDPFTSDFQANAALWRTRAGAKVHFAAGAKHFNGSTEPAVHDLLRAVAMAD